MLPPKLGHILGSLAFSETKFCKKKDPTPVKSLFENTMGKPFFYFFQYWPKLFKKEFRIEIWAFSFQICFRNQFLTSGSGQTKNTHLRVFVYFPFNHFLKPKIYFESRFEKKIHIFLF